MADTLSQQNLDLGERDIAMNGHDINLEVESSGRRAHAESLVRRWNTDAGTLIDDPTYGTNLTDIINDDMTDSDIARLQADAEFEALKDERTNAISSSFEVDDEGVLTITFSVEDGTGTFEMTVSIDEVTVDLLTVTP